VLIEISSRRKCVIDRHVAVLISCHSCIMVTDRL